MGQDRLTSEDLAIALVRNLSGAALKHEQLFALANAFAKVVDEFYQANQDFYGMDEASELAGECAMSIDRAHVKELSDSEIAHNRILDRNCAATQERIDARLGE